MTDFVTNRYPEHLNDLEKQQPIKPFIPAQKDSKISQESYDLEVKDLSHGKDVSDIDILFDADDEDIAVDERIQQLINSLSEDRIVSSDVVCRILKLLMELTPVLQKLAAGQADFLNSRTELQRLYTDLITKAPYEKYDKEKAEGDSTAETGRLDRNEAVTRIVEKLRSYRDNVGEVAKRTQSQINTLNESSTSINDLFTTLIQQLRELGSLIFR